MIRQFHYCSSFICHQSLVLSGIAISRSALSAPMSFIPGNRRNYRVFLTSNEELTTGRVEKICAPLANPIFGKSDGWIGHDTTGKVEFTTVSVQDLRIEWPLQKGESQPSLLLCISCVTPIECCNQHEWSPCRMLPVLGIIGGGKGPHEQKDIRCNMKAPMQPGVTNRIELFLKPTETAGFSDKSDKLKYPTSIKILLSFDTDYSPPCN